MFENTAREHGAINFFQKAARFLDKTQDSGTIVKFVEELRQAILVYQVWMSVTTYRDYVRLILLV